MMMMMMIMMMPSSLQQNRYNAVGDCKHRFISERRSWVYLRCSRCMMYDGLGVSCTRRQAGGKEEC